MATVTEKQAEKMVKAETKRCADAAKKALDDYAFESQRQRKLVTADVLRAIKNPA